MEQVLGLFPNGALKEQGRGWEPLLDKVDSTHKQMGD